MSLFEKSCCFYGINIVFHEDLVVSACNGVFVGSLRSVICVMTASGKICAARISDSYAADYVAPPVSLF